MKPRTRHQSYLTIDRPFTLNLYHYGLVRARVSLQKSSACTGNFTTFQSANANCERDIPSTIIIDQQRIISHHHQGKMSKSISTDVSDQQIYILIEPEEDDRNNAESPCVNRQQLSSSCHTATSTDSIGEPHRRQRQMRRLSFGNCHTTVEFDHKMPVSESLLSEYDSPAALVTNCRWEAEATCVPKQISTMPKQSRPTWTVLDESSKVMPKLPTRNKAGGASCDTAPIIPHLQRRIKPF